MTKKIVWILLLALVLFAGGMWLDLCASRGTERLSAWGSYLTGIASVVLAITAVLAGFQALQDFKQRSEAALDQSKLQKAQWMGNLYERFYLQRQFKNIRRKIDFDDLSDVIKLLEKDTWAKPQDFLEEERKLFDSFTDYLNFLEFVAYLKRKDQLDNRDIEALFSYYLKRLNELDQGKKVREYIENPDSGFENLRELLATYQTAKKP